MNQNIEEILRDVRIRDLHLEGSSIVEASTPLSEVYDLLEYENRGAVVICGGSGSSEAIGIFTERDVLYRTALERIDPSTPVSELMTAEPKTLPPSARLADAILLMIEGGYRHVPVAGEDGCAAGLLTSRDVLRFIAGHFSEAVVNLPPRLHQTMNHQEGG